MKAYMRLAVALSAAGALAGCDKTADPDVTASSAAADVQMDAAGHALSVAADHAAAGVKDAGAVLVANGKVAAANAASQIGTAASQASTQLRHDVAKTNAEAESRYAVSKHDN